MVMSDKISCKFMVIFNNEYPVLRNRVYWLYPLNRKIHILIIFSLNFMPFLNETIVIKKLPNKNEYIFLKTVKTE